jgi:hypothetical protein
MMNSLNWKKGKKRWQQYRPLQQLRRLEEMEVHRLVLEALLLLNPLPVESQNDIPLYVY